MTNLISITDIVYAAVLALLLTILIQTITKAVSMFFKPIEIEHTQREIKQIIEKCQSLFPRENVLFDGQTFKRGMNVRVVTNRQKIIEGELIGINSDDMICLLTSKFVVAQDLRNIKEMKIIK